MTKNKPSVSVIKKLLRHFIINWISLYITTTLIQGFIIDGDIQTMLLLALGFTVFYLIIKPIVNIILKPVNFLTFGFVGLIFDMIILYFLPNYFPNLIINSWQFTGFNLSDFLVIPARELGVLETVVVSSIALSILRTVLELIMF